MNIIKEFFKKKGLSFYFIAASFVFILIVVILYANTGVTQFSLELSPAVIVLFSIGLAASAVSLWKEFQALSFGIFLLLLWGFLEFIISQADYLGSIFAAIDDTLLTPAFICTVLFSVLACICALVSAIIFSINRGRYEKKN